MKAKLKLILLEEKLYYTYIKLLNKLHWRIKMTTPNGLEYTTPEQHTDGSWHTLVTLPDTSAHDFAFYGNAPLGGQIDITYTSWKAAQDIAEIQADLEQKKTDLINELMGTIEQNLIGTVS